jgi:hypothetical protein
MSPKAATLVGPGFHRLGTSQAPPPWITLYLCDTARLPLINRGSAVQKTGAASVVHWQHLTCHVNWLNIFSSACILLKTKILLCCVEYQHPPSFGKVAPKWSWESSPIYSLLFQGYQLIVPLRQVGEISGLRA